MYVNIHMFLTDRGDTRVMNNHNTDGISFFLFSTFLQEHNESFTMVYSQHLFGWTIHCCLYAYGTIKLLIFVVLRIWVQKDEICHLLHWGHRECPTHTSILLHIKDPIFKMPQKPNSIIPLCCDLWINE